MANIDILQCHLTSVNYLIKPVMTAFIDMGDEAFSIIRKYQVEFRNTTLKHV